jgi:hypothetical protein
MSATIVLPDGFKIEQLLEIRSKLAKVYDDWIENFKEKSLEKAKEFTVYFGRDISMNFITTKFRLTAQAADEAESKNLTFLEVRRILNWMLHGNDPFKKWCSVKDTDLKESLMDSVVEKTKKMLIKNDYPENLNVTFAVEDAEEKGNYTIRIFKPKTSGPDAPRAVGGGGGGKPKTEKVKMEKSKKMNKPSGSHSKTSIPDADVLDVLITAVEAIAELKKINLVSQGQKTSLAMKLSSAMDSVFESI